MIVKVQISQFSSDGKLHVLIYNKDQSVLYEAEATKAIAKLMGDRPKAFFHAILNGSKAEIGLEAPWQDW